MGKRDGYRSLVLLMVFVIVLYLSINELLGGCFYLKN